MLLLVDNVTELLNPDWFAYGSLFDTEGGWLAEQGRDPFFLLVIQLANQFLGPDGYGAFRDVLGVFFIVFTLLLAAGCVLPFTHGKPALVAIVLAVTLFTASRFTIQIREGLAMVFVLLALRQIWGLRPEMRKPLLACLLMLAATLMHGGIAFLLMTLLVTQTLGAKFGRSVQACQELLRWTPGAVILGIVGTIFLLNSFLTAGLVGTLDDGRESVNRAANLKYVYWAVTVLCMVGIAKNTTRCIQQTASPPELRVFIGFLAYLIMPAVLAAALTQLALGSSGVLIAATTRLLQIISNLLIIIIAARNQMTWPTGLASLIFTGDQVRVSVDSITGQLALLSS